MALGLLVLYFLIFWAVVALVVAVVLRVRRGRPTPADTTIEQVESRYARGEMSHEEYEARRREIKRSAWRRRRAS